MVIIPASTTQSSSKSIISSLRYHHTEKLDFLTGIIIGILLGLYKFFFLYALNPFSTSLGWFFVAWVGVLLVVPLLYKCFKNHPKIAIGVIIGIFLFDFMI